MRRRRKNISHVLGEGVRECLVRERGGAGVEVLCQRPGCTVHGDSAHPHPPLKRTALKRTVLPPHLTARAMGTLAAASAAAAAAAFSAATAAAAAAAATEAG